MNNKPKDWTDILRETLDGAELTPSEGGWERLEADMRPRRAVWWPYLTAVAACAVVAAFIFRTPSQKPVDVLEKVSGPVAVAERTAEALESPSAMDVSTSVMVEETAAMVETPIQATGAQISKVNSQPATAETPTSESSETMSETPVENAETPVETAGAPIETAEAPVETAEAPIETAGTAAKSDYRYKDRFEPAPLPQGFPEDGEIIERAKPKRRTIVISVSAGGMLGSRNGGNLLAKASSGTLTRADNYEVMDISEMIVHETPRTAALSLTLPVGNKCGIDTGLDYSLMNSTVGSASQSLEWIGVPLMLNYGVAGWGGSGIDVGAGIRAEKCLSAKLLGMNFNESAQWAASLDARCHLAVFGPFSIELMPELSYYFTDTVLPTYRYDRPLTFRVRAGLSVNL